MLRKLGTTIFLLFILSSASADELVTYLIHTHTKTGETLQGTAFTDSDRWEVNGYVMLEQNSRASFVGSWTRQGKIEVVDSYGTMYMFDVIRVLNDEQALNLTDYF